MEEKSEDESFLEQMPAFSVWYKVLFTYLFQFILFILAIIFFCWVSSKWVYGAIIGQSIIAFSGTLPYIYMANNCHKIRKKYRDKYGKLAFQKFWYNYHLCIIPLQSVSLYLPLLLKTNYFLPAIMDLPSHTITKTLFPIYLALPFGIIVAIVGLLILRPSIRYSKNVVGNRYHLIYPEKSRIIIDGIFRYIRNPQYLGRGIISIGFGIIANNILAISVGFIHFLSFLVIIPAEDKELTRRFGDKFLNYKKKVPMLFPRYGNWIKFVKHIFQKNKK